MVGYSKQLQQSVEKLRRIPLEMWRPYGNGNSLGYAHVSAQMKVVVGHDCGARSNGTRYFLRVEDLGNERASVYHAPDVTHFYHHLKTLKTQAARTKIGQVSSDPLLEELLLALE